MSQLEDLLQQCTVKLSLSDRAGWGTGFFVAPGWILTCAHVIQAAHGQPIQVRWQNQENWAEAVVERSIPDPYDLALLRVTLPTDANPPCVLLGEEVRSRDPLYLFGYPDEDFPNGCPVTLACEGLTGDTPPLIKFALGQVRPGMSGAPLLNQRTGKVCGIVKFTRDRSFDLGGGAISAAVILEQFPQLRQLQQQFHQLDQRWSNLLPTATNQSKILDDQKVRQYLDYLSRSEWWNSYRLTEAISAQQATFTFEQMVQTEEQSQENPAQKEKRVWVLLEGIIHYAKSESVLLVGAPGLGKSTTLLRLLVVLARQELRNANPRIPVLIRLKDYANSAREGDSSGILALIQEALKPDLFLEITDIETLLFQENRFILLLDGLNEIPANVIQNKLTTFRQQCDRARVPLVCTTRNLGFDLGIQRKLQLQTLEPSEIQRFLEHCMPGQEQQVLNLLNKSNPELGKTPFVLWMLYDVFKKSGEIPGSIGEAFRKFKRSYTNYKLNQEGIPVSEETIDSWNLWLEYLAFEMLRSPDPHDPGLIVSERQAANLLTQFPGTLALDLKQAQAEIKNLLKYHLLQKSDNDEISFCHQLIQEYYAAERLCHLLASLGNTQLQQDYLNCLKWTEVISIMLGLPDITSDEAIRTVELALEVDLRLGSELAGAVHPDLHHQAIKLVANSQLPHKTEIPKWLLVELLGDTTSRSAITYLQQIDTSDPITYKRFLIAIGQIGHRDALPALYSALCHEDCSIRNSAAWAVQRIYCKEIELGLLEKLSDLEYFPGEFSDGIHEAIEILQESGFLNPREILLNKLYGMLASESHILRGRSAVVLGKLGFKEALPKLCNLIQIEHHANVRCQVVRALGDFGCIDALPYLSEVTNSDDENQFVREAAIQALGNIPAERTVHELRQLFNHEDSETRRAVALALRNVGEQLEDTQLVEEANSRGMVISFGTDGTNIVLGSETDLIERLSLSSSNNSQQPLFRWLWVEALGGGFSEEGASALIKILEEDTHPDVRKCAARSLGEHPSKSSVSALLRARVEDPDSGVQWQATISLGIKGVPEVANDLYMALEQSADSSFCWQVAQALSNIEEQAAKALLPKLKRLIPTMVGQQAFWVMTSIQSRCKVYNYEIAVVRQDNVG